MQETSNGSRLRLAVLEAIKEHSKPGRQALDFDTVKKSVVEKLSPPGRLDHSLSGAVLSYWNDLIRTGHIGFGRAEGVWDASAFYVADEGRTVLEQADRDPINPGGYMAYLDAECPLEPAAKTYVAEALNTYRACCYKATAVLIGAAVELLVLSLRDAIHDGLTKQGASIPSGLDAWQVKTALEASTKQILPDLKGEARRKGDDALRKLCEEAESRLLPIAADFRRLRNNAGHPATLEPVLPADVHANLLLFPAAAKLLKRLKEWAVSYYA